MALYWTVSNAYQVAQTLFNNPFKIIAERQAKIDAEKEAKSDGHRKKHRKEIGKLGEKMKFTGASVEEAIQNGGELNIPRKSTYYCGCA